MSESIQQEQGQQNEMQIEQEQTNNISSNVVEQVSDNMQIESSNNNNNELNNSPIKQLKTISSYEIDNQFQQDIKKARVQQDFLKNINVYEDGKYFYGLTEQMNLNIFSFDEQSQTIQEVLFKSFPQPLYDSIMLKNKQNQDIIAVSIKNQPINLYRLQNKEVQVCEVEEEQEGQTQQKQQQQQQNKLELKNIGYLTSQKKNTELYQTPLQFRYDTNKNVLMGAGKQFLIQYDLNKFSIRETYEKFNKSDIVSCFDIPNPNSSDYSTYSNVVAYGKFDRTIQILDFNNKKTINSFGIHLGGITCLRFDQSNSNYLYSGARKDDLIYLWDLRKQDTFVHYYSRKCTTNQRMSFDVLSNTIAYGHQSGEISIVNTETRENIIQQKVHEDCVNSVKLFKRENKMYCLSSAGQRHYNLGNQNQSDNSSDDSDSSDDEIDIINKNKINQSINNEDNNNNNSNQNVIIDTNKNNIKDKGIVNYYNKTDNTIKLSLI